MTIDTSLTEFLSALVSELADPTDTVTPALLHTVHDNFDADEAIIEAFVARHQGTYIACTTENNEPLAAPGTPRTEFLTPLQLLCERRNMPIDVHQDDDSFTLSTTRFAGTTGASATILNVLTVLLSSQMDQPLVVLSYELSSLDEATAQLLWDACGLLQTYPPGALKTFVPLAAGPLNVPTHCNPTNGARFVIRDHQFFGRNRRPASQDTLTAILRDINQPIVLFLGAGASASSRMPDGNRVRDFALGVLTGEQDDPERAIALFRDYLTTHGQWLPEERNIPEATWARDLTLERVMREEFRRLSGTSRRESRTIIRLRRDADNALERFPAGREALWKLAELLPRLVIATVNFDQLIEVGMSADHVVLASPDEFETHRALVTDRLDGSATQIPILKVHGSIERPETIVADIDSTSGGLPRKIADTLTAMTDSQEYLTWVWVGCSMRDVDIAQWLRTLDGARQIKEFWVDPLPPASVTRYAQQRRRWDWAQHHSTLRDRQITETSDVFFTELLKHANALNTAQ